MGIFALLTALFKGHPRRRTLRRSPTQVALETSILNTAPVDNTLHRSGITPRPVALETSILGTVPVDIIIYIAQFLPTASAASFALCCHTVYRLLGTRYWEKLKEEGNRPELQVLLSLLERDLPGYVLCYHCTVLHVGNGTHYGRQYLLPVQQTGHREVIGCSRAENSGMVSSYIYEGFRYGTFQMAMKRHRLGLDYSHYLITFNCKSIYRRYTEYRPRVYSTQARIVAGSLLLRIQQVLFLPSGSAQLSSASHRINICTHIGTVVSKVQLPERVQCKIAHRHDIKQCIRHSGLAQCSSCPTEYQIDLQECGQAGIAVISTKWLDLGEGRTPLDPKWWSHLSTTVFHLPGCIYGEEPACNPAPFEAGSIHASFEQDGDLPLGPLLILE